MCVHTIYMSTLSFYLFTADKKTNIKIMGGRQGGQWQDHSAMHSPRNCPHAYRLPWICGCGHVAHLAYRLLYLKQTSNKRVLLWWPHPLSTAEKEGGRSLRWRDPLHLLPGPAKGDPTEALRCSPDAASSQTASSAVSPTPPLSALLLLWKVSSSMPRPLPPPAAANSETDGPLLSAIPVNILDAS